MAMSSSLLVFIFLTTTHFHFLSHASPPHVPNQHHHDHLRTVARQSTSASAANGGAVSVELWCVAKNNAEDSTLQSALDWACGSGGSDCGLQQGGPCYDTGDIQRAASYAFNDYFLKHGMTEDSCNFDATAALTSLNPSHGSCKFPSSFTVNNGSFTGSPTTVGIGPASADISGINNYSAGRWCLALITTHLFYYAITLII